MIQIPKYVCIFRDRHGKRRIYYRRFGRRIPLFEKMGTPEFSEEMLRADADIRRVTGRPPAFERRASFGRDALVYFILHGPKRVKIGYSTNVNARLASLQTSLPGKARILYVTPGDLPLERKLHRLFHADRVSGEWFIYSPAIRQWIAEDIRQREEQSGHESV